MQPEGMEDLAAFSAREEESSSRGKRKRRVFLCRRTVGVKVKGKLIPASFLNVKGRGMRIGAIGRRQRDRKKNG